MDEELENELSEIFARDAAERDKIDRKAQAARQVRFEYIALFRRQLADIIQPALEDFASSILQYGWSGAIEVVKEGGTATSDGHTRNRESVSVIFSTANGTLSTPTKIKGPTFAIICEPDKREIRLHGTTTTTSGPIQTPEIRLDLITEKEVQKLALGFFTKLFAETKPR